MLTLQSCQNLPPSSPESCEDRLSVSSLTESPSSCRRSTRLLTNGYYVLSDNSIPSEDEGNISPSTSQANISYKENIVHVFNRRRRRPFRSLAGVFNQSSHESLLEGMVPDGMPQSSFTHSTWMESTEEREGSLIRDRDAILTHPKKTTPQTDQQGELHHVLLDTEACFSQEQFSHSLSGVLHITPQSPFAPSKLRHMKLLSDSKTQNVFYLIILLVCLLTAVFSWWILGGLLLACLTFTFILAFYEISPKQA